MIAQVKYHYKVPRLPDDMDWDEFFQLYQELQWIRTEESKHNLNTQLKALGKALGKA